MSSEVVAGLVAAVVALLTYVGTQSTKRTDDRRQMYARALAAVTEFEELPYRILRRTDDLPETRRQLADRVRDVQQEMNHHTFLLKLESTDLGATYAALVNASRAGAFQHRQDAWKANPETHSGAQKERITLDYGNAAHWDACIAEMRRRQRGPAVALLSKALARTTERNKPSSLATVRAQQATPPQSDG